MKEVDANRVEAFKTLVDCGMFIPFDSVDHFHGRTNQNNESWSVDPHFNNSGNSTGNRNIQAVSALSTGDYNIAADFANARSRRSGGMPEVHKIVSTDEDALMFNFAFDIKSVDVETRSKISKALSALSHYSISELDPAKFEDKDDYKNVLNVFKEYYNNRMPNGLISFADLKGIKQRYYDKGGKAVNDDLFVQISGAANVKYLIKHHTYQLMFKYCNEKNEDARKYVEIKFNDGSQGFAPINMNYLSSWFGANHIVGARMGVDSATLNRGINANFIFDISKVMTEKQQGDMLQSILNEFGELSTVLGQVSRREDINKFLENANAEEIMDWIRKDEYFQNLYSKDARVWEKFSVGEHTETVLRVFENSFEDSVPPSLVPFVKVVLMSHDIGKGVATSKADEKSKTDYLGRVFYDALDIPKPMQELMLFIINGSQDFTTDYYVNKNVVAEYMLKQKCNEKLMQCCGKSGEDMVEGLASICKILQNCDSAAYTRYAVTKDKDTGVYYWNGNNTFTKGFKAPVGMKGQKTEFYSPEEWQR